MELIGAHTQTRPALESGPCCWTEMDDYKTYNKLLAYGKVKVDPILTRLASPRDAAEVFRMLHTEKNPPLGVVLDWRDI